MKIYENARTIVALWKLLLRIHRHSSFFVFANGLLLPGVLSLWAQTYSSGLQFSRYVMIGTFVLGLNNLISKRAGQGISSERVAGIWNLLATARVTRNIYLGAQLLDLLVLALVPLLGIAMVLLVHPGFAPRSGLWLAPSLLGIIVFAATALLIAASVPPRSCGIVINALSVFTLAFCPLIYPPDRVPAAVWPLVRYAPATLVARALSDSWDGGWPATNDLALLLLWCAITVYAALRWFPWTEASS